MISSIIIICFWWSECFPLKTLRTSENSELVCQAFVEIFKWSAQMKITISSKIIHTQFLSLQDEVMAHTTTNSVYELTVVSKV